MFDQCANDAPTVRAIWNRTHIARKAGRRCDACKEPVNPGDKYETWGLEVDGKLEISFHHANAYRYPSGCPRFREQDIAEAGA